MDFPEMVRVVVTQNDIDHGAIKDCLDCPVARAFVRAITEDFLDGLVVEVSRDSITVRTRGLTPVARYRNPPEAVKFISLFDQEGYGRPFSFESRLEETNFDLCL